ncbi:hypothetical protein WJX84_005437, partial [Apatococcus fuscideae]
DRIQRRLFESVYLLGSLA